MKRKGLLFRKVIPVPPKKRSKKKSTKKKTKKTEGSSSKAGIIWPEDETWEEGIETDGVSEE